MATMNQVGVGLSGSTGTGTFVGAGGSPAFTSDITVNSLVVGRGAGNSATNVALGYQALTGNTGTQNTGVGQNVLSGGLSGITNTVVGGTSMQTVSNGSSDNTIIGYISMAACASPGSYNTSIGSSCFTSASFTGQFNSALGRASLSACTSGSYNVGAGGSALSAVTSGQQNTALGFGAAAGQTSSAALTTGTNNTLLGYFTDTSAVDAVGTIAIGSTAVGVKATGNTSGDNGPGISIGSSASKVGFRGDGTVYPTAGTGGGTLPLTFTGYWRVVINGTAYKI